jgi:hypothetical protein
MGAFDLAVVRSRSRIGFMVILEFRIRIQVTRHILFPHTTKAWAKRLSVEEQLFGDKRIRD